MFFFLAGLDELIQLEMAEDPSGLHAALESTSEDEHITPRIWKTFEHEIEWVCLSKYRSITYIIKKSKNDTTKVTGTQSKWVPDEIYLFLLFTQLYEFHWKKSEVNDFLLQN